MTHQIRVVDVFTKKLFAGNQLAVVLDAEDIPGDVMQRIAVEMNYSETTFLLPPKRPANAARVRIFTPGSELPFAGHPTIGTAWVLVNEGLVPGGNLDFTLEEGVGPVPVRAVNEADGLVLWMRHPKVAFGTIVPQRHEVASALGLREDDLLPDVPNQMVTTMDEDFVLVAQAKGLPTRTVIWYAARNALLPVISNFTIAISILVAGQILVEIVFNYPGIGFHLFDALSKLDYALVQGIFVVITLVVLAANLLADVIYVLIDPRARQVA